MDFLVNQFLTSSASWDMLIYSLLGISNIWCLSKIYQLSGSTEQGWKQELTAVEETLRGLISEAGEAGKVLNRELSRRKIELEKTITKLDSSSSGIDSAQGAVIDGRAGDLPNESWTKPLVLPAVSTPPGMNAYRATENANASTNLNLDTVVERQVDRVSITQTGKAKKAWNNFSRAYEEAQSQRQKRASNTEQNEQPFLMQPPNSVSYSVARRLLSRGQEIHVVARKLELSLSEVRQLDREMRGERFDDGGIENEELIGLEYNSAPRTISDRDIELALSKL